MVAVQMRYENVSNLVEVDVAAPQLHLSALTTIHHK